MMRIRPGGMFLAAGILAASLAGMRAVGSRRARKKPSGIPEASISAEERRGALSKFGWRRRSTTDADRPSQ